MIEHKRFNFQEIWGFVKQRGGVCGRVLYVVPSDDESTLSVRTLRVSSTSGEKFDCDVSLLTSAFPFLASGVKQSFIVSRSLSKFFKACCS